MKYLFDNFNSILTEDQQALEDEGIILPMKSGFSSPPHRPMHQLTSSNMGPAPQFGGHSSSSYQPYYGVPPAIAPPVTNSIPNFAPSVGPTEPPSRKKSIIENITPYVPVPENKKLPAEYMNAFPVSENSKTKSIPFIEFGLFHNYIGGSTPRTFVKTVR